SEGWIGRAAPSPGAARSFSRGSNAALDIPSTAMHTGARHRRFPSDAVPRMDIGKDLVAASATPLVLAIVAEADTYCYAILKRVGELSGGRLQWTDGMLYPVLHRLERQGHIEGRWGRAETGRRRKYYRITERGLAELADQRTQ